MAWNGLSFTAAAELAGARAERCRDRPPADGARGRRGGVSSPLRGDGVGHLVARARSLSPRSPRSPVCSRFVRSAVTSLLSMRIHRRLDELYAIGGGPGANRPHPSPAEDEAHRLAATWLEEAGLEVEVDRNGNLLGRSGARRGRLGGVAPRLGAAWRALRRRARRGRRDRGRRAGRRGLGGRVPRRGGRLRGVAGAVRVRWRAAEGVPRAARRAGPEARGTRVSRSASSPGSSGTRAASSSSKGGPGTRARRRWRVGRTRSSRLRRRSCASGTPRSRSRRASPRSGSSRSSRAARTSSRRVSDEPRRAGAGSRAARRADRVDRLRAELPRRAGALRGSGAVGAPRRDRGARSRRSSSCRRAPGHDAGILATAGVDAAMLFVRSLNGGVSHSPDELSSPEDVELAVDVLTGALRRLATSR